MSNTRSWGRRTTFAVATDKFKPMARQEGPEARAKSTKVGHRKILRFVTHQLHEIILDAKGLGDLSCYEYVV